jgi:hypothetical protein
MYTEHETAPSHEEIAYRAYEIYLEHGFHEGNDLSDWLAAEKELTEAPEKGDATRSSTNSMASLRRHATA